MSNRYIKTLKHNNSLTTEPRYWISFSKPMSHRTILPMTLSNSSLICTSSNSKHKALGISDLSCFNWSTPFRKRSLSYAFQDNLHHFFLLLTLEQWKGIVLRTKAKKQEFIEWVQLSVPNHKYSFLLIINQLRLRMVICYTIKLNPTVMLTNWW